MGKPRKGQRGTYRGPTNGEIGFVVHSVDGNLCWSEYDNDKGNIQPFIWRFKDGYNTLHYFDGTDALPAQANKAQADCMGDLFA